MKNYFVKSEIHRDIMKLAWPSILEQMLIMMVGMVSTIFVGRIGTSSVAAVGLINMLIFFFQAVFAGLATGSTVVIARITGEGDHCGAKNALMQSLYMGVAAGLSVAIPGYLFAVPLIHLFFGGADPEVLAIGLMFYRIVLFGLPFLVLDMIIAGSMRGAGDTKTPMYVTGIVNIINLILSVLLIFGVSSGGVVYIPAFGVKGSAIAVTAARFSGAVIRLFVLFALKGKLNLCFGDDYSLNVRLMFRIIKVGFPAFMEQLVMQGGFLIMQVIIVSMGTVSTAVYQVGVNVNSLAFMPIFGFAIAATTMVGQSLGRCEYDKAETYAYETTKIATAIITILGILMFIFAKPLAMLYSTDPQVIDLSVHIIRIFACVEPFLGIMNVCAGTLRAAGDIMYVTLTAIVGLWTFRVMIALILHKYFGIGLYGVMAGICTDFTVRAAMYLSRMRAGKWKLLKV